MTVKIFSSREFNQDVSKIKKASLHGPVFITDRGKPSFVLLAMRDYEKLTRSHDSMADLLAMPEADEIPFEPGKLNNTIFRPESFE